MTSPQPGRRAWRLAPALLLTAAALGAESSPRQLFPAIRENDLQQVRAALAQGSAADARNADGTTALMYAALHADLAGMKLLLDKGADPNVANQSGATALMWAAADFAKVKLLLDKGADPNARSKEGRTALLIAARIHGSADTLRLLMSKGADPNAADELGGTALMMAAETGDLEVVRLLLDKGADVNRQAAPGFGMPRFGKGPPPPPPGVKDGYTALILAAEFGNQEVVRLLLDKGADPNRKNIMGFSALSYAVLRREVAPVRMLLDKGADVHVREMRQATPLILAASSDETPAETIRLLLAKGADWKAKDASGRTALDWASLRGHTELVAALRQAASGHTTEEARITEAVNRSLALLQTVSVDFAKKTGCISCHHESLNQLALKTARERGFTVDEQKSRYVTKFVAGVIAPHREPMLQAVPTIPVSTLVSSYTLVGQAAEGHPADEVTDALVIELAARQRADGRWTGDIERPPLGQGDISATALSLQTIKLYAPPGRKREFEERIRRASAWLATYPGQTTQEKAMRLLGLAWAGAATKALQEAAEPLLAEQRADGGWAQLETLESDAYATGQTLVALFQSGLVKANSPVYRRAVAYLLDTQHPDGSWHVRSRALGFQPYFESGYPHGHDQWISAAGGSWATMALALTREPRHPLARTAP